MHYAWIIGLFSSWCKISLQPDSDIFIGIPRIIINIRCIIRILFIILMAWNVLFQYHELYFKQTSAARDVRVFHGVKHENIIVVQVIPRYVLSVRAIVL